MARKKLQKVASKVEERILRADEFAARLNTIEVEATQLIRDATRQRDEVTAENMLLRKRTQLLLDALQAVLGETPKAAVVLLVSFAQELLGMDEKARKVQLGEFACATLGLGHVD